MWRVIVGFFLCATTYPVLVLLGRSPSAIGGAALVATFTVGTAVIVGVPLFAWLRRRRWLKLWQVVVGGGIAGAIAALPFIVSGWQGLLFFAGVFAAIGAGHALLFWLVAIYRNNALFGEAGNSGSSGDHAT